MPSEFRTEKWWSKGCVAEALAAGCAQERKEEDPLADGHN